MNPIQRYIYNSKLGSARKETTLFKGFEIYLFRLLHF